jgi:hypothetical protein
MTRRQLEIDSGILQFAPKGAFYEEQNEQFQHVMRMWEGLFNYDRTLFCLITLLGGTGFSKGVMSHMLLSTPQSTTGREIVPEGLSSDYETEVILYNLSKEKTPRALKNLLMFVGRDGRPKVNNARTRKLILEYIFNRNHNSLDNLAVNYKGKLRTLVRHALGRQDLTKILLGDEQKFQKWIGRYHPNALPVLLYLFDRDIPKDQVFAYYEKIDQVLKLKEAAKAGNVEEFRRFMKDLPRLTVLGYRNTYKVPIDKSEIFETTKMSSRQALQMEAAAKRTGTKVKVNYKNQDLYDLWKALYFKLQQGDQENLDKIVEAIGEKDSDKLDIGEVSVVFDVSRSMVGSEKRPLHPFLTGMSILSILDNIQNVFYVGGTQIPTKIKGQEMYFVFPANATSLWKGLVDAVNSGAKKIIVISDAYENAPKGMFQHVYKHFKEKEDVEVIHINPVFSADAAKGSSRKLAEDIEPLPVASYKYLETEIIFKRMLENRDLVKKLLIGKYRKLIGG